MSEIRKSPPRFLYLIFAMLLPVVFFDCRGPELPRQSIEAISVGTFELAFKL